MASQKKYEDPAYYEAKLERVMNRLGVEQYEYDWSRFQCWIQFPYKGQFYRFEHSVENAKAHGQNVIYGSDVFAQVVLALEDISRMTERGIYELQTLIAGFKALPEKRVIPKCFVLLGFTDIPSKKELQARYLQLAKVSHPDVGGDAEYFMQIQSAKEEAEKILEDMKGE